MRRAALLAAGTLLSVLPPSAVAGAMLAASSAASANTSSNGNSASSIRAEGGMLAVRLEWVARWCRETAERDADSHCRLMAQACVNLQVRMTQSCF